MKKRNPEVERCRRAAPAFGVLIAILAGNAWAGDSPTIPLRLETGAPFARTLAEDGLDRYEVALDPGRWRFRLAPNAHTARLKVVAPQGEELLTSTTSRGLGWEDAFLITITEGGIHRLEISAENRGAKVGGYQILVESVRATSPAELALAAADEVRTAVARFPLLFPAGGDAQAAALADRLAAAARELRSLDLRRAEVKTWLLLADFTTGKDARRAEEAVAAAWRVAENLGNDPLRVQALEQRAYWRQIRGDFAAAREDFAHAAELWQARGIPLGELRDRLNVATLLVRAGDWEDARRLLRELHPRLRVLGERRLEISLLASRAGVQANLGESEPAIADLRAASALAQELEDFVLAARLGNDLGVLLRRLGETGDAIKELQQALAVFRRVGDHIWQARALNNLGYAYLSLDAKARAGSALDEALALRQAAGDRAGVSVTLKNLIRLALLEGDLALAEERVGQVLALDEALASMRGEATAWRLAGQTRARRGNTDAARQAFDRSLELCRRLKDPSGEAQALLARGELTIGKDRAEARSDLEEALAKFGQLGERDLEVATRVALGRLERQEGDLPAARRHFEKALEGIETLRTLIADPVQRASFLAARSEASSLLIDVLLTQHAADPAAGRAAGLKDELAARALEVSEKARARVLLDWLEAPATALDAGLPPALRERFHAARRRLNAKSQRQVELLAAGADAKQNAVALTEAHQALAELEAVRAAMAKASPAWAQLAATSTLAAGEIQALLEKGTTLLEFSLGAERSVVFEVSGQKITAHSLPGREEIEDLARRSASDLSRLDLRSNTTRRDHTAALAKTLFAPLGTAIWRQERLVIVADGALELLPFAALPLPDGQAGSFLLDRCEVVQLSSASALAAQRRLGAKEVEARGELAIFADPVFEPNDERLAAANVPVRGDAGFLSGYGRLPESSAEAAAILALAPTGKTLVALGFDANRERFEDGAIAHYRVLHFATHGVATRRHPELTGILLSQFGRDGRPRKGLLSLQDLLGLRLEAELVVLSGCSTALGEEVRGEGLLGLSRGFLYAGVPRLLASLWPVQEKATRTLMEELYRAFFLRRMPPAAALREAQRELRRHPRYADPFYWGAFVLLGDWR